MIHQDAHRLIKAFWPGDLALLLPWRDPQNSTRHPAVGTPALVTHSPGALGQLATMTATPIAATTVNISGDAGTDAPGPAVSTDEVDAFLKLSDIPVSIVIDGGVCPAANHLTIVDCATPHTRLIRAGLVHERALSAVLNRDLAH